MACLAAGSALTVFLSPAPVGVPDLSAYRFTYLSRAETEERSPQWSPDGKSIAYTARIHGLMQVFTRVAGAPDAVQLTRAGESCSSPFWSPDSASIYYISGRALWSVPAAGGAGQMVLDGVDAAALHPDGQTLAFDRDRKLWIGSLKGGEPKALWQGPANGGLSFSPDGSMLAAESIGPIWLFPFPSGTPRKFDLGGAMTTTPSWFPDSRHMAVAVKNGDETVLSIVDATDGTRRTVASAPMGFPEPSVSPEGKRIAYAAGQFGWDVLEISLPEGHVQTLISGGVSITPDWAPSGNAFHLCRSYRPRRRDRGPAGRRRRIFPRRLKGKGKGKPAAMVSGRQSIRLLQRGRRDVQADTRQRLGGRIRVGGLNTIWQTAWHFLDAGRAVDHLSARSLRETESRENPSQARGRPGGYCERQASALAILDDSLVARRRLDRVSGRGRHRSHFAGRQIHAEPDFA